MVRLNVLVRML